MSFERLRERLSAGMGFAEPCLPSPAKKPPAGSNWIHEDQARRLSANGPSRSGRRQAELERLDAILMHDKPAAVTQASVGRAAVQGMGGVGKNPARWRGPPGLGRPAGRNRDSPPKPPAQPVACNSTMGISKNSLSWRAARISCVMA
jgi:hypothetical protein